jgi:CRISPR system Cascade subunit CasE
MYLSRLTVNPRNREARRDLADCEALHNRLLTVFPIIEGVSRTARRHFGVLYRVDQTPAGLTQILMQSEARPDWAMLPEGFLLAAGAGADNPACKNIEDFYRLLTPGLSLRFRLRANPTRKIESKSGVDGVRRNGKRVELRGEMAWQAWIGRKGEQHGFALRPSTVSGAVDVQIVDQGKVLGRHGSSSQASNVTLASVLYNGSLVVTDVERFAAALRLGIGSGKAYGFGLMSVARLG